jgi:hypothetical protein
VRSPASSKVALHRCGLTTETAVDEAAFWAYEARVFRLRCAGKLTGYEALELVLWPSERALEMLAEAA